jgi:hypothetical protein
VSFFVAFGFSANAEESKFYIENGKLNYRCPDGVVNPPADMNIDLNSVKILKYNYFVDKNKAYTVSIDSHGYSCVFQVLPNIDSGTFVVYSYWFQKDKNHVYYASNYWGWTPPYEIKDLDIDPASFIGLEGYYAKDINKVYYFTYDENGKVKIIPIADSQSFEVFKEDVDYAMDKNNMYFRGDVLAKQVYILNNYSLYNKLKGKIVLKSESKGEAYYINPNKKEMYFLSRPVIAFRVMREQGIGISNKDLEKIPVADNYCPSYDSNCDKTDSHSATFANLQKGKIFLQVENNGEAWYVNPSDSKRYFLGRPGDAFNLMKKLGLGISNANYDKLIK